MLPAWQGSNQQPPDYQSDVHPTATEAAVILNSLPGKGREGIEELEEERKHRRTRGCRKSKCRNRRNIKTCPLPQLLQVQQGAYHLPTTHKPALHLHQGSKEQGTQYFIHHRFFFHVSESALYMMMKKCT